MARWHQTLKNRILLENHCLPGAFEVAIGDFVDRCNHRCVHESHGNVTPADTTSAARPPS
jgi:putative transposase